MTNKVSNVGNVIVLLAIVSMCALAAVAYGYLAIYPFSYWGHFSVACVVAVVAHGFLRLLPDATPDYAMLVLVMATVTLLATSHLIAYQSYSDAALEAELSYREANPDQESTRFWIDLLDEPGATGSPLDRVRFHLIDGVIFEQREFYTYGAPIEKTRDGVWALIAWLVQALTLPFILGAGIVSGAFFAHNKVEPPSAYETALDYLLESQMAQRSPIHWKPAGLTIRPLQPGYLLHDFFHSYLLFTKPILILAGFLALFPEHESKGLFAVMISFFMLHAANAILTGNHDGMRLKPGKIFEQFMIFVRFFVFLFLSLIFGFLVALVLGGPVAAVLGGGAETVQTVYLGVVILMQLIVLTRLWPMVVIHYIYDDVNKSDIDQVEGLAANALDNNLWYGAPGPSVILAWRLTGQAGAFLRATIPALLFPILILYVAFSIGEMAGSGILEFAWTTAMVLLVAPLVFLILMDRSLALREAFMPREAESDIPSALEDSDRDFLDSVPGAFVASGDQFVDAARQIMQEKILKETEDNPSALLQQAIIHADDAWFDRALASGADPNGVRENGEPIIFLARSPSRTSYFEKLVSLGADVTARDARGRSMLHIAAGSPDGNELIERLVALGCDIHAKNNSGETPIDLAARADFEEKVANLAALGADHTHLSVFEAAVKSRGTKVLNWLLLNMGDNQQALASPELLRLAVHYTEALRCLLDAGMDANLDMGASHAPLFVAAGESLPTALKLLLEYGADPFKEDGEGRTALGYCFDWDGRNRAAADDCTALLHNAMDLRTRPE